MHKPLIILLSIFVLTLSSCLTTRQTNYMQQPKDFVRAYKDTIPYKDYELKTGDRLFIQIYTADEKTNILLNGSRPNAQQNVLGSSTNSDNLDLYSYIIQPNGSIYLPQIGDIQLKGKTLREARHEIEDHINQLIDVATVDVRLMGRFFNLIGAGKSGRFPFPREKVNIFQALAIAGDLSLYSNRSKIKIIRETGQGTVIKEFDVRSEDIIHSEYYYLEPNDVLVIEPMKRQFFGAPTFWTALSTVVTTYSFGIIIYKSFIQK